MFEVSRDSADIIYYNATISNNSNQTKEPTECTFTDIRNPPLLKKPDDWYMSIIRFSIPAQLIPQSIMPYPTVQYPITPYSVTLTYQGDIYQEFIQYENKNTSPPQANQTTQNSEFYYYMYDFSTLLGLINTAFALAFAKLKQANSIAAATEPPFFTFDPTTNLFSLNAQQSYSDPAETQIYLNTNLQRLFADGLPFTYLGNNQPNGMDCHYYIGNTGNNSIVAYNPDIIMNSNPVPTWLSNIFYIVDDTVYYQGDQYVCILANNNQIPASSPLYWTIISNPPANPNILAVPSALPWFFSRPYVVGEIVSYTNVYYICAINNTNLPPNTNPLSWPPIPIQNPPADPWIQTNSYNIDDEVTYGGSTYVSLTVGNVGNNPQTSLANWELTVNHQYYQMQQYTSSIYSWQTLSSLVFISNTIPVNNEYIKGLSNDAIGEVFRPILTDFEPDLSIKNRDVLQYVPQAQYRYTELNGQSPLTTLQLSVYWQDNLLNLHPILIPYGSVATIKSQFIKKSMLKYLRK